MLLTQQERASLAPVEALATGILLLIPIPPQLEVEADYICSVTKTAGGMGGSASNYGNGIKDYTKASGPRTQTAQNPLGTSSNSYGGKKVLTGAGSKGGSAGSKGTAGNPLGLS